MGKMGRGGGLINGFEEEEDADEDEERSERRRIRRVIWYMGFAGFRVWRVGRMVVVVCFFFSSMVEGGLGRD
jgi:hypothetical protein